tara:strand:+ start:196 stop:1026 length:831 start_codon:yes stop_codon:yes gene_type:complete
MPDSEDYRIANMALARLGIGRITDFTGSSSVATVLNDQYDEWRKELIQDHPWNFATRRSEATHFSITQGTDEMDVSLYTFTPAGGHTFYNGEGNFKLKSSTVMPPALDTETSYKILLHPSLADTFFLSENGIDIKVYDGYGLGTLSFIRTPIYEWDYSHLMPLDCLRVIRLGERDEVHQFEIEQRYINHNYGSTLYLTYLYDAQMSDVIFPLFKRALALKIAIDLVETGIKTTSVLNEIENDYMRTLQRAKTVDAQERGATPLNEGSWAAQMGRES